MFHNVSRKLENVFKGEKCSLLLIKFHQFIALGEMRSTSTRIDKNFVYFSAKRLKFFAYNLEYFAT